MTTLVPGDVRLTTLSGESRTIGEWTTTFHLVLMALDPFTYESSWILPTAGRILRTFAEADCRTSFLVTGTEAEARQFLGPWAKEFLTFVDPSRATVTALGCTTLPAFVHVNVSHEVEASAEGWEPDEWRTVAENLARIMSWHRPVIPTGDDPVPFAGTPAAG